MSAIRRLAWALAAGSLACPAGRTQPQPAHIPASRGITLAGTSTALPQALNGKPAVLVIGFSKASQTRASAWGKRVAASFRQSATMNYFEISMLAGAPRLLRSMIVRQMTSSVPEEQWTHFLVLMEGEAEWRSVAHYSKPDQAYVLLVDGQGIVRWQTDGPVSDAAFAILKTELARLSGIAHP